MPGTGLIIFQVSAESHIDTHQSDAQKKYIASLFSTIDLDWLMQLPGRRGPSLLVVPSGLHWCRVAGPAWSLNLCPLGMPTQLWGIILASCWHSGFWPVASGCEVPLHSAECFQAPPQGLSMSICDRHSWVSRMECQECHLSVLHLPAAHCSCDTVRWWCSDAVALHAGLGLGLHWGKGQSLCFHLILSLLPMALQTQKDGAVSRWHHVHPGPAPALSSPLKQTEGCREDKTAEW